MGFYGKSRKNGENARTLLKTARSRLQKLMPRYLFARLDRAVRGGASHARCGERPQRGGRGDREQSEQ